MARLRLKTIKANANAAALDARRLIAQTSGTVNRLEVKTLEVLTALLESVTAFTELAEDIQDGVEIEMTFMGRKMPVTLKLVPKEDTEG